ncbi:MarR family winged helix-turn-helix transcriptional regulator [Streptomyces tendae]
MADASAEGRPDYTTCMGWLAQFADSELNRLEKPPALAAHMTSEAWRALSFGHGLIQVARLIERQVDTDFARPAGLSVAGFRIVSALKLNGPQAPSQLADQLGLTRASVTSSLDTLERDRLVVRAPQPDDGRRLLITLTPEGDSVIEDFLKWLSDQPEQEWFESLTRDELVVLDHLLRKAGAQRPPESQARHTVKRRPPRRRGETNSS